MPARVLRFVLTLAAVLAVWEFVGRIDVTGVRIFPPPSAILAQYVTDADIYLDHIRATVVTAAIGFVIGNAVAIAAAMTFFRFPAVESLFHGVNVAVFAVPMIVVGPVLVLVCGEGVPQIVLSALAVYFPTMAAMLVGLRDVDPRLVDLVQTYGGGKSAVLRFVSLRAALPSLFAGLKVAASLAVLGAILGEFGSGERWGLGTFLLGSLGQANAAQLWGIGLAAAGVALAGYGVLGFIGQRFLGATMPVTVAASRVPDQIIRGGDRSLLQRLLLTAVAIALPFLLWGGILSLTHLSPIIAPGPLDTFHYLFVGGEAHEARATLATALGKTLPVAGLGIVAGLAAAFVLAALAVLMPGVSKALLPAALVLQCTPLVALAPLALLLFGRDTAASLALAVLVVFFPAFVLLSQGLALVPKAALEVVEVYGGSRLRRLLMVSLPYSIRYLFAAAKLVAPRALLGVMIAEWLLTGTGLGNLLDVSRSSLDYGMVWSGAVASILVAVAAYQAISLMEKLVR
jgi:ABC-type nitrate/sulfonate/bicarbonate transport system permease component